MFEDLKSEIKSLEKQRDEISSKIDDIKKKLYRAIFEASQKSDDEVVILLGKAFAHSRLKIKPDDERLGYHLADLSRTDKIPMFLSEIKDPVVKEMVRCEFDYTSYIFGHTHYDVCDNGYFRRDS